MLRLVNANGMQLGANDSFGLLMYDHATCMLGNPSSALMSMVEFRGFAHSTMATAMVWGGILIELVKLSGISVVCSWTSMITYSHRLSFPRTLFCPHNTNTVPGCKVLP